MDRADLKRMNKSKYIGKMSIWYERFKRQIGQKCVISPVHAVKNSVVKTLYVTLGCKLSIYNGRMYVSVTIAYLY